MTIRFLQTCASENPEYPFQAGQIITVTVPSDFLLGLLDGVRAEIIPADVLEMAVAPVTERPEPVRSKQRKAYARH